MENLGSDNQNISHDSDPYGFSSLEDELVHSEQVGQPSIDEATRKITKTVEQIIEETAEESGVEQDLSSQLPVIENETKFPFEQPETKTDNIETSANISEREAFLDEANKKYTIDALKLDEIGIDPKDTKETFTKKVILEFKSAASDIANYSTEHSMPFGKSVKKVLEAVEELAYIKDLINQDDMDVDKVKQNIDEYYQPLKNRPQFAETYYGQNQLAVLNALKTIASGVKNEKDTIGEYFDKKTESRRVKREIIDILNEL